MRRSALLAQLAAIPVSVSLLGMRPMAARADAVHDELAPGGRLRVAIAISPLGGPFWSAKLPNGNPSGVPVDLGLELGRRLNAVVSYVIYQNSGQITDGAARGEWDVAFLPMDADRATLLAFGPVYSSEDATFIVRAGLNVTTPDQLDVPGMRIAAVANTTTMRGAQRSLKNVTIVGYQSAADILTMLRDGEIDAFANLRDQLVPLSATIPGSRVLPGAYQQTRTAIAVPLGKPPALAYAADFMRDVMTNGVLRRIYDEHGLHDLR
jgi:polar amino acid transport system substrate-binding protein